MFPSTPAKSQKGAGVRCVGGRGRPSRLFRWRNPTARYCSSLVLNEIILLRSLSSLSHAAQQYSSKNVMRRFQVLKGSLRSMALTTSIFDCTDVHDTALHPSAETGTWLRGVSVKRGSGRCCCVVDDGPLFWPCVLRCRERYGFCQCHSNFIDQVGNQYNVDSPRVPSSISPAMLRSCLESPILSSVSPTAYLASSCVHLVSRSHCAAFFVEWDQASSQYTSYLMMPWHKIASSSKHRRRV